VHTIQSKLLELSRRQNLAQVSLREMARLIGLPHESPQKIKHHLMQLQRKGFIAIDKPKGLMERSASSPSWATGLLDKGSRLFSIPIIGVANCGPATIFAEQNFQGFLRISGKLLDRSKPDGLYAIRADGTSMNRADVRGKRIEDGDYAIVDSRCREPKNNQVVVAIVDNRATIKRFIDDRKNGQIVLQADSSFDYEPIYLHPEDDFTISGTVVDVIKRPTQT
jgi:SOS-response transcriptional repressor LexA